MIFVVNFRQHCDVNSAEYSDCELFADHAEQFRMCIRRHICRFSIQERVCSSYCADVHIPEVQLYI